ncbi:MAG: hypothetical protein FIA99_04380 [Ruminiclostridium sp.]|nr:hypothetical protein [Ruminiclostridium sp.]
MIKIILLLFFTVALPILIILWVIYYGNAITKQDTALNIRSGGKKGMKDAKTYNALSHLPVIGNYLTYLKSRLNTGTILDEYSSRNKAVYIALASVAAATVAFIIALRLYGTTFYMKAVMLIFSIYLGGFMANSLSGNSSRLLEYLSEFINDIKHHYHASGMVDESIYEAAVIAEPEMELYGKKLYRIINSSAGEKELEGYYERCPNKFLKILAGFSYMVKEYGDRKINGVSLCIKNLNYIIEEIYLEIVRKSQLAYWLKGLPLIAILPVLFPPWIEKWMSDSFPASGEFFRSSTAFLLKNLVLFLVAICYILILQLKGNSEKGSSKRKKNMPEQKLLEINNIEVLVSHMAPKPGSLKHKRLSRLIGDSGTYISLKTVYLRRLLCGIAAFMLFISIFLTSHRVNVDAIMNDAAYGISKNNLYMMLGKISHEEQASKDSINRYDTEIIKFLDGHKVLLSGEKVVEAIKAELDKKGYQLGDTQIASERIYNKLEARSEEHLKLWEILLCLLLAFIFSYIPIWLLYFRKTLRKADMQDEVFQFHTVILLLMNHESVDVRKVLEWMHQLSDVFREPINRCLNNFHDPKAALAKLKEDVKFKEFTYLIENLEMASDKISLREAFDSLELDRDFYRENRKEANKRTVSSRIELGKLIGFIPFYGTIIFYLLLPLLLVSITSLKTIIKQLGLR